MTLDGSWSPDRETIDDANLSRFIGWLRNTERGVFTEYQELWEASVGDVAWFWEAVWHFFDVRSTVAPGTVLADATMPGAQWFPGVSLNYVTEVFRHETDQRPALVVAGEDGTIEWSWERLRSETAAFANFLRRQGVTRGDRVVGYIPNIGEAVVAFLGAAAVVYLIGSMIIDFERPLAEARS